MTPTTPTSVPQTPPAGQPRRRKAGRSVVLHCVPWEMYTQLLDVFAEKRGVRLAYDNEELEIMAPSLDHDFGDRILADLVKILAEELGRPYRPGGQTTLRRRKKLKGIEADDVFWIEHAAQLAGVRKLDLRIHPPPDLAVEVDVSHSSLNRLRIYAALGVPEVWRLEGDTLTFYVLAGKQYAPASQSRAFPIVAPTDLVPFVQRARAAGDEIPVLRDFRAWVRQRIANPPSAPPPPASPPPP